MSKRESILVVDETSDTAEVLQAVLAPRGVLVNRVCRWGQTENPTVENRPAVVVYDAESMSDKSLADGLSVNGASTNGAMAADGNWHGVPQIIIGTMRVAVSDKNAPAAPDAHRRYLQKPFQFAELVQAIETLIAPRAA